MKYAIYRVYNRKAPDVVAVFDGKEAAVCALDDLCAEKDCTMDPGDTSLWRIKKYFSAYDNKTKHTIYHVDTYPKRSWTSMQYK